MFVVSREPQFTHPVKVQVPIDGGHREEVFKATFRVMDAKKVAEFDLDTEAGTEAFLKAAIVELDDLADEKQQPLTYSDELRDQLIDVPFVRRALISTYVAAVSKAARGN
jgi:hypothetical protein